MTGSGINVPSVPSASFRPLSYNDIYHHVDGGDGARV